jgi:5-methylcytosine-specific restriction endonuclease McrA
MQVPKPTYRKRKRTTDFSRKTRQAILERDNYSCVRCGRLVSSIHHIRFRSELTDDVTHKRNGVCVCITCHSYAHERKAGREWFREFKRTRLDENGDYV